MLQQQGGQFDSYIQAVQQQIQQLQQQLQQYKQTQSQQQGRVNNIQVHSGTRNPWSGPQTQTGGIQSYMGNRGSRFSPRVPGGISSNMRPYAGGPRSSMARLRRSY